MGGNVVNDPIAYSGRLYPGGEQEAKTEGVTYINIEAMAA